MAAAGDREESGHRSRKGRGRSRPLALSVRLACARIGVGWLRRVLRRWIHPIGAPDIRACTVIPARRRQSSWLVAPTPARGSKLSPNQKHTHTHTWTPEEVSGARWRVERDRLRPKVQLQPRRGCNFTPSDGFGSVAPGGYTRQYYEPNHFVTCPRLSSGASLCGATS